MVMEIRSRGRIAPEGDVRRAASTRRIQGNVARPRRMLHSSRATGRPWCIGDGEHENRLHPRTFFIPRRALRESLTTGDRACLLFFGLPGTGAATLYERIWVEIVDRQRQVYSGKLLEPSAVAGLEPGAVVRFGAEHVVSVEAPERAAYAHQTALVSQQLLDDGDLRPGVVIHDPDRATSVPTGELAPSGWVLLAEGEPAGDPNRQQAPSAVLEWLMERYPEFGSLVLAGAANGVWRLDSDRGIYLRI